VGGVKVGKLSVGEMVGRTAVNVGIGVKTTVGVIWITWAGSTTVTVIGFETGAIQAVRNMLNNTRTGIFFIRSPYYV
jgi:hypothetical protein